jgi:hypothetical protein
VHVAEHHFQRASEVFVGQAAGNVLAVDPIPQKTQDGAVLLLFQLDTARMQQDGSLEVGVRMDFLVLHQSSDPS